MNDRSLKAKSKRQILRVYHAPFTIKTSGRPIDMEQVKRVFIEGAKVTFQFKEDPKLKVVRMLKKRRLAFIETLLSYHCEVEMTVGDPLFKGWFRAEENAQPLPKENLGNGGIENRKIGYVTTQGQTA